ncbi:carboxylesterase family protein [Candidatus Aalborgicola defluviihabitans]|uniref:carboxylesterase family protein n=1 Tax=Candidatus Aalborgicola defluviihabitans TaxID=3386187 RepID=UPI001ED33418|nr:carboxylesterase family protein [Burkholderiales bacterium]
MSNLTKIRTAARLSGLVLLFLATACAAATMAPLATQNGDVQGLMQDGVAVFRGLPYAASPEGDLRWRPPNQHRVAIRPSTPQCSAQCVRNRSVDRPT